jgi:hypothetical protein
MPMSKQIHDGFADYWIALRGAALVLRVPNEMGKGNVFAARGRSSHRPFQCLYERERELTARKNTMSRILTINLAIREARAGFWNIGVNPT